MYTFEDCTNELMQDFIASFKSEWSPDDCELAERVIIEETERYEDGYRELTEVDEDHYDDAELTDFWDEVKEQVRFALRANSLI